MSHQKSQYPRKLREAAVQEVAAAASKKLTEGELSFDYDHAATPRGSATDAADRFDSENWVAKYPGQNSPHVGNGSGGPR